MERPFDNSYNQALFPPRWTFPFPPLKKVAMSVPRLFVAVSLSLEFVGVSS